MQSHNRLGSYAVFFTVILFLAPAQVQAQEMVVGVNVVNPMRAGVADRSALIGQLKAAQARVIRCGISNDDKGIDFAKRACAMAGGILGTILPDANL